MARRNKLKPVQDAQGRTAVEHGVLKKLGAPESDDAEKMNHTIGFDRFDNKS